MIKIYLARGTGKLDYNDEKQFDISAINEDQKEDLMEILKCVRLPLIPAEIIISKIQPSSNIYTELIYFRLHLNQ